MAIRKEKAGGVGTEAETVKRYSYKIHFNIGTFLYLAVFTYMIIRLVIYFTETHVTAYQVVSGPLTTNDTYRALVFREERVVTADTAGYLKYYISDSAKIGKNSPVCSVSTESETAFAEEATEEQKKKARNLLAGFTAGYDSSSYDETYSVMNSLSQILLGEYTGTTGAAASLAEEEGIVTYSTDGYEIYTVDSLSEEMFDMQNYQKSSHVSMDKVSAGEPIYRLITDETWQLALQITDRQFTELSDIDSVQVKFLKDGQMQKGSVETRRIEGKNYAVITLYNGMIRYAQDRFLYVELVTNMATGLKIPTKAIVRKEFYRIPAAYVTKGGNDDESGVLCERLEKDGSMTTEFLELTLYRDPDEKMEEGQEQPAFYYADKSKLQAGEVLAAENSQKRYTVKDTGVLRGVYNINQGYAVFKQIQIKDKNDEYAIVEPVSKYDIAMYDYIVADASAVEENQIME